MALSIRFHESTNKRGFIGKHHSLPFAAARIIPATMGNPRTFTLPVTRGTTYKNQTIQMDGKRFEDCRFENCTLIYSGGHGEASACYFSPDTVWGLQGTARIVLETLQRYGWRIEYGSGPNPEPIRFPSDAM